MLKWDELKWKNTATNGQAAHLEKRVWEDNERKTQQNNIP